MNDANNMNQF